MCFSVVSHLLDFSRFLRFPVALYTFEAAVTSSSLCLTRRETPWGSPVRDSEAFSGLPWVHLLRASHSLLRQNFEACAASLLASAEAASPDYVREVLTSLSAAFPRAASRGPSWLAWLSGPVHKLSAIACSCCFWECAQGLATGWVCVGETHQRRGRGGPARGGGEGGVLWVPAAVHGLCLTSYVLPRILAALLPAAPGSPAAHDSVPGTG